MDSLYKDTGKRIRLIRERRNLSRSELALSAGISAKFLYEIELGKKGFSAEALYEISKNLHISSDYLLNGISHLEKESDINEIIAYFSSNQIKEVLNTLHMVYNLSN